MCINYILLYIYSFSLLQSTFKIKVPEVDATAEAMYLFLFLSAVVGQRKKQVK